MDDNNINNFCVAVSGGEDSLALSFLAKCYSLEKKTKAYFFIVDHKIRKNSTLESNIVKNKLKRFKIVSEILTFKKQKKISNLQSFARENRYNLIINQSLKKKFDLVLTAHHEDDLLENFFIRLLRGSGLKGLISFRKIKSKVKLDHKIPILRPLIDVSKKDLVYITKNTFNFNVYDPSNEDDQFLRVKVRKLISKLEKDGLTFNKFKVSLRNLSKSNDAIDYFVQKNINDNSTYLKFSKKIILKKIFLISPTKLSLGLFQKSFIRSEKKNFYQRVQGS